MKEVEVWLRRLTDRPLVDWSTSIQVRFATPQLAKGTAMLSITRRSGEEIVVIDKKTGEQMTIIVRIQGNQVRFGMQASQRFQILRKEVHDRQLAVAAD